MKYLITKTKSAYILSQIVECDTTPKTIDLNNITDIRKLDNSKIIGKTNGLLCEQFDKSLELYLLDVKKCDELFDISERRTVMASSKYLSAPNRSHEQLKGISEVIRQQIYHYLSGRITHEEFISVYYDYERFLGESKIIKVNGMVDDIIDVNGKHHWQPDNENEDDEYYNDFLEDDKFKRVLAYEPKTSHYVNIITFANVDGYVEFEKTNPFN